MRNHERTGKISSTTEDDYNDEINPIEDIIERLNHCRVDYYKLYKKDQKFQNYKKSAYIFNKSKKLFNNI